MLQKAKKKAQYFCVCCPTEKCSWQAESMHFPIKLMTPYDIL